MHQYRPHIEELNELTQSLITVYQHDDASKIKKIAGEINRRYTYKRLRNLDIQFLSCFFFVKNCHYIVSKARLEPISNSQMKDMKIQQSIGEGIFEMCVSMYSKK